MSGGSVVPATVPRLPPALHLHLEGLHLGALHPFEQLLVVLLAFGPFVVLAIVIGHVRRRDARERRDEESRDRERRRQERRDRG